MFLALTDPMKIGCVNASIWIRAFPSVLSPPTNKSKIWWQRFLHAWHKKQVVSLQSTALCALSWSVSLQPFNIRYQSSCQCHANHVHHVEKKLARWSFIRSETGAGPRSTLRVIHRGCLAVARDAHKQHRKTAPAAASSSLKNVAGGNSEQRWSTCQTNGPTQGTTPAPIDFSISQNGAGGNSVHL